MKKTLRAATDISASGRIEVVTSDNPAALVRHDPQWTEIASGCLAELATALVGLPGALDASLDHIGSTSIPDLAAKPFIDLQVRILPLPGHADLAARLAAFGYEQALGSRPDSPGVDHDIPYGSDDEPAEVWEKRLYVAPSRSLILHLRRADSPWGRYTVWFRDWLRADPDQRRRYEDVKRALSAQNAGKPDYDDYTRAKSAFFRDAHPLFCAWAAGRES